MTVNNTIGEEHTRRSRSLHDALPEENVRYMIQQCLQKQPNKKWQAIGIDLHAGEQHLNDIVLIHHYYTKDKRTKTLQLITETMRLNMLPPPELQTFQMQQIVSVVDRKFKTIFAALNYSYIVHSMTTVTQRDVKRLEKYLASSDSNLRPAGLRTMRDLADDIFGGQPDITVVSMSLLFALLATVLMNVIDAYETLEDVEKRLLQTLATRPEIYILMVSDMKQTLASKSTVTSPRPSSGSGASSISKYIQFSDHEAEPKLSTSARPEESQPHLFSVPDEAPRKSIFSFATTSSQPTPDESSKVASEPDVLLAPDEPLQESWSSKPDLFSAPDEPLGESPRTPAPDDLVQFPDDDFIDAIDTDTLPKTDSILAIRIRHPITGRCLHVGGKSFQQALDQYGIETLKKWSVC